MKIFFPVLAIILLFSFGCDNVTNPEEDQPILFNKTQSQIVDAGNYFGFKLLREISAEKPDTNVFISPISVSMMLGMAMNGAVGATYDSMRNVLGFGSLSEQKINESYFDIITILTNLDPNVLFEIANAIWINDSFAVNESFLQTNNQYFDARAEALDFSDPTTVDYINAWVSEKTHEKIPIILERTYPTDMMYLMNALYFNGSWTREFSPYGTRERSFYLSGNTEMPIKMMSIIDTLPYFETDTFQAVDLPYGEGNFSMTIILPRPEQNVNTLIDNLDFESWLEWMDSFEELNGSLNLPKFSLTFDVGLYTALKTLGMGIIFNQQQADFSRTSQNTDQGLYISDVLHKTFLQVDEQGTEAAAVTAGLIGAAPGDDPFAFVMIVNRPFLCVIRERTSNTILFAGKVMAPEPVE